MASDAKPIIVPRVGGYSISINFTCPCGNFSPVREHRLVQAGLIGAPVEAQCPECGAPVRYERERESFKIVMPKAPPKRQPAAPMPGMTRTAAGLIVPAGIADGQQNQNPKG